MRSARRPLSPLSWLRWLVIISVVPAWAVTAWIIASSYEHQRDALVNSTTGTARALMRAVERDLAGAQATLEVLAISPYLASGDLAAFHRQAREALERQPGNGIVLADPSEQQVMSTIVPYGRPLPRSGVPHLVRHIVETGKPVAADFYIGATSKRPQVAVGVPVFRDGKVAYALTMGFVPERLGQFLRVDTLPPGSIAALLDSKGTIVARTQAAEQFVGRPASSALRVRLEQAAEGTVETSSQEGTPVLVSFSRSEATGWTVAIGIPVAELTAQLRNALWLSVAVASLLFLIGVYVPRLISLRIEHAIRTDMAAAQQLEAANRAKTQFLATMSHELRTPLNAIIGFSEVLKDGLAGDLTAEQRSFIRDIHASGQHLLSLINDILDLSKVEAGMMTLDLEPVELAALLQGSLTMIRERAMKHRLALDLALEPGLPAVAADPRRLKQIAFNLLSNAAKFTTDGGRIRLRARRVARADVKLPDGRPGRMGELPAGEAGEFIEIEVADSGIGIGEAHLGRLFQSFVQIDSALGRQHQGTGLGLALVKRLAELHGGAVGVSSVPGEGSSFFVWLPLREAPSRPPPAPAAAARRVEAAEPLALVVEDDDAAAEMIERFLRAEGLRCRRAATAEEALVLAAKQRPDLITLDIFLPHMDGWQFLERLKADRELANIPVVIISVADNLEHGLALGATRVLHKPFSEEELHAALAGVVAPGGGDGSRKVLIADDNAQAVEVLAGYLSRANYRLLRAYGGREAIEAASRARPDLILLDLVMPDLSGFDVVQRLKAHSSTAAIPIVVVTAKDLTAEERATLNGSVQRIVEKNALEAKDFVAEVRRALRQPGAQG